MSAALVRPRLSPSATGKFSGNVHFKRALLEQCPARDLARLALLS